AGAHPVPVNGRRGGPCVAALPVDPSVTTGHSSSPVAAPRRRFHRSPPTTTTTAASAMITSGRVLELLPVVEPDAGAAVGAAEAPGPADDGASAADDAGVGDGW